MTHHRLLEAPKPEPKNDTKDNENKLIYILAYPSVGRRRRAGPISRTTRTGTRPRLPRKWMGELVAKVESVYMNPTDYSPIK